MRNSQLLRQLALLRLLQRGPASLGALACELQVSGRTVRRDLDVLSLSGFTVTADNFGDGVYWRLLVVQCPVCGR